MRKRIVRVGKDVPKNLSRTFIQTLELISDKPILLEKLAEKRGKGVSHITMQVKTLESMGCVRRIKMRGGRKP